MHDSKNRTKALFINFFSQMQRIVNWIKERPALSVRTIEDAAGMPRNSLANAVNDLRPLPKKWILPLVHVLSQYGLEIDGWKLTAPPGLPFVFGLKVSEPIQQIEKGTVNGETEAWIKHSRRLWDVEAFLVFFA